MTKVQAAALEDGERTGTLKAHSRTVDLLVKKGWASEPFRIPRTDGQYATLTFKGRQALSKYRESCGKFDEARVERIRVRVLDLRRSARNLTMAQQKETGLFPSLLLAIADDVDALLAARNG